MKKTVLVAQVRLYVLNVLAHILCINKTAYQLAQLGTLQILQIFQIHVLVILKVVLYINIYTYFLLLHYLFVFKIKPAKATAIHAQVKRYALNVLIHIFCMDKIVIHPVQLHILEILLLLQILAFVILIIYIHLLFFFSYLFIFN